MKWEEIKGQAEAVNYLRRSLEKGATAHAYLFQGPDGVGKALTARVLAQTLNCRRGGSDPCGECPSCLRIEEGSHPDVLVFSPRGKSRTITIDQLRRMQRAAHLNAAMAGWKVFILRESETMNEEAANSLLKTLEEPPEETLIILISSRPEQLPATIRSRCQTVNFKTWPEELMLEFLIEKGALGRNEAEVIAGVSGGRPGRALKMTADDFFTTRSRILETLRKGNFKSAQELTGMVESWLALLKEKSRLRQAVLEKERKRASVDADPALVKSWEERDQARAVGESRADLELVFELILSWFRDLYILRSTGRARMIINRDQEKFIRQLSASREPEALLGMMNRVEFSRRAALDKYVPPRLVLENLFLQLGFWKAGG